MDRFRRSLLDLRRGWRDPRAVPAPPRADTAAATEPAAPANPAGSASATGLASSPYTANPAGSPGPAGGAVSSAGPTGVIDPTGAAVTAGGAVDDDRSAPVYRGEMIELVYSRRRSRQVPPWAEASDRDLLLALREGDEAALDELIGRKTKPLLQLVTRILGDLEEARDVVQVTFFKVWENRAKFDERWSPNTWIYRIASNLAIDHLRSRRSRERSHEPVRQHLRQVADGRAHRDLSRLQQGEVATIFRELAASLSEKQRLVFLMREVEGLSSPEVAGILGCRESTVRNHLFNARKYLRGELLRRYPEYAANFASVADHLASAKDRS
jgi:RNA polymerase sigma-70 factor (ECF subfamily)